MLKFVVSMCIKLIALSVIFSVLGLFISIELNTYLAMVFVPLFFSWTILFGIITYAVCTRR